MIKNWRAELESLHGAATRRLSEAPGWDVATRRARELSTAAVILDMAGVSADELLDAGIDRLPADVAEALERIAPDFDIETIASYPAAALEGLGNTVKGAFFELQVADAVAGGAIHLPAEVEEIHLVEDFTNPGYDAELIGADGTVLDVVQLKTSQTADIIAEHLERHPGIDDVWTSHEAAADAAERGIEGVFDTQISDEHLSGLVHAALADQASTSFVEVMDEVVPQITYAIIAAQAGWRLMQGAPAADVIAWAQHRAGTATAMSAIAGLASMATGTDFVRVPVVIGVSMARAAYIELDGSTNRLDLMSAIAAGIPRRP